MLTVLSDALKKIQLADWVLVTKPEWLAPPGKGAERKGSELFHHPGELSSSHKRSASSNVM